jgi:hypothetical protein
LQLQGIFYFLGAMKKLLYFSFLLFSCSSPTIKGEWTVSNLYLAENNAPLRQEIIPFQRLVFFADSVAVDEISTGIIREKLADGEHLIFVWNDTTRYFLIKSLEKNLLILETSSFTNGKRSLLSLKR